MDINKYIGLCLVKNGYCSIPGLGILRLQKNIAKQSFNSEVSPVTYTIVFENVNSIDDQFAHFIGIQENISSNNASNALSKFGKGVKEQVVGGNPYIIDGLGRFTNNAGKPAFTMVSDFDMGDFMLIPPTTQQQTSTSDNTRNASNTVENEPGKLNFTNPNSATGESTGKKVSKILLPILLIAGIGAAGYFGYKFLQNKQKEVTPIKVETQIADSTTVSTLDSLRADSIAKASVIAIVLDTTKKPEPVATPVADTSKPTVAAVPSFKGPAMKVAILTFTNEESAKLKCTKLSKNGNPATVQKVDSVTYNIVISLPSTDKPAEKVIDSLRKFFNPSGKVYQVK
jgi:hypothetical protein